MKSNDLIALGIICTFVVSVFYIIVIGTGQRLTTECVMRVNIHNQDLTFDEISKLCGVGKWLKNKPVV